MKPAFQCSYIEISKSAFAHNLNFLKKYLKQGVQISSVVKGNAYGHGIECFVPLAESYGVDHFSVFSANEAQQVFHARQKDSTIMIMGYVDGPELEWAIENGIEFYVFEMDRLMQAQQIAEKLKMKAYVHLEAETGMNRTGFSAKELTTALHFLEQHQDTLHFQGICTHLAGAESIANYYRIRQQQKNFDKVLKKIILGGFHPAQRHMACSAAAIRYPKTHFDLVRLGIIQYGFFPTNEVLIEYMTMKHATKSPLQRLISWKTTVMDTKEVKKGEFIGYGTSYLANSDCTIATIPIGYSQGFSRSLSNSGWVLIHGKRVPVIGTVNMNMITVDISSIEEVHKGDEVVLIGKQDDLEISISSFSEFSDMLNYELLTRLPADIPRFVVE
ncbi:MAG TPA: alanine racemase [Bacteroidetes bacterium]|nr:alanine racemase [Bacteroidota bacterium]